MNTFKIIVERVVFRCMFALIKVEVRTQAPGLQMHLTFYIVFTCCHFQLELIYAATLCAFPGTVGRGV